MKTTTAIGTLLVTAGLVLPCATAHAQEEPPPEQSPVDEEVPVDVGQDTTAVGLFLGYDFADINDPFLGVDARLYFGLDGLVEGLSLVANPALNLFLISEATLIQLDANALARMPLDLPFVPYAGLGLAVTYWSFFEDSDLNLTFNPLIVGGDLEISDNLGGFAQLRATRHSFGETGFAVSTTTFALMAGIQLRL